MLLLLAGLALFFGIQSKTFQTWLGKKAGTYLSDELHNKITLDKVNIEFFSFIGLEGITILDQHNDTLFHGTIKVDLKDLDYQNQSVKLERILLENATSKIIWYKDDTTFNFNFIADYFKGDSNDTTASAWKVSYGDLELRNVSFIYRDETEDNQLGPQINYFNLRLDGVSGEISGFRLDGDTIYASVNKLTAREQSGFILSELSGKAKISEKKLLVENLTLKSPRTSIKGKIDFSYSKWDDYVDFITNVEMDSEFRDSSYVNLKDVAAFTSELQGLDQTLYLSGRALGYVNDLRLKNFKLAYGRETYLEGNFDISGLPDYKSTFLHFNAREISTIYTDIESIPEYPFNEGKKMSLPVELKRIGKISYRGKFDGFLTDFTTYGTFNTGLGRVKSQLTIRVGEKDDDVSYKGKIVTEDFDLGVLIGQNDLNNLSITAELKGHGLKIKTLDADISAEILNLNYNKYNYKNVKMNGSISNALFTGLLSSRDENANLDFNGTINFDNKVPEMDFIATLYKLNLSELNFTGKADSGSLSSQLFIKISGDNIDNLSGQIYLDNSVYKTKTKTYKLSTLNMVLDQSGTSKKVNLSSADINAYIKGNYNFTNLPPVIESILYNYYPSYFRKPRSSKNYSDHLEFKVSVKNYNTISELFTPGLMFSPGTILEGNISAPENKLNVQLSASEAAYNTIKAKEIFLIVNENAENVLAEVSARSLHFADSLNLENFDLNIHSADKYSKYKMTWNNLEKPFNNGEISGNVFVENSEIEISNEKLELTINDSTWQQTANAKILFDSTGRITFSPFKIKHGNQSLSIAGTLSDKTGDSLVIGASMLRLEQFNPLLRSAKIKLEGVLNGDVTFSNQNNNFIFDGDLDLQRLKLNDNTLGELVIKAGYNSKARHISMDGFTSLGITDIYGNQTKNISFNGYYYLDKKEESIDVKFSAKPANISLLNPFLEDILTIKSGFVNGEGKIGGTPDKIKIDGKFKLFNSEIKVDYTNVSYNVTGEIEIMSDQIRFSDLLLREKGSRSAPQGTVNGNIFHNNFERIQLDYDITYRNMLVLNTTQKENKDFYGRVYSSGNVGLYGFINNLNMKIVDTTTKGTKFFLPLDSPAEIGESDFIHFVKKDTVKRVDKPITGFNLDLSVYATPDAQVQIILDYQEGDMLNVQGQGNIDLKINTLGKFEMTGAYFITSGDYLFTLENVINKKFDIEAGSSISWSGNPMNAEIDVVTSYKQRASVAPLLNDTSGRYKARFPVDLKLLITGKLFSPNIDFSIDIPNIDATAKSTINNVLSDEGEMNRQVFSLLLFRSFVTPLIFNTQGGGVSAGGAAASTSTEFLSNRVSSFLNTYFGNLTGIKDLQLGLNYRPGNQNNSEAIDLALSKQFLNNKLAVEGNLGVNNQARSNGLIGDVSIDYKLSEDGRYRLKGFNRSNDNTQTTIAGGPFTQGVGFAYREEFETFSELFNRYMKRIKKKPKE